MKPMIKLMVFALFLNANLLAQNGWLWQNPLPQGNQLWDIHVFDQNTALAVGEAGTVMKTTDGGINWHVQRYAGGTAEALSSVFFIDANTGWTVGSLGTILKTTDGGSAWSAQSSGTTYSLHSVYFVPQGGTNTGWAVGGVGTILKTTDGGSTWSAQTSGARNELEAAFFIPQGGTNTGWAVGLGGAILKTTNGETALLNIDVQEVAIQAKPGETATSTLKLSNTGTADLSFNITASGPTGSTSALSAALETRNAM